ncbi:MULTISPECIES: hypothetical protein [Moraxella]|uniref:Phage replication initiation protein n=1 Tax=Moraxella catarrhalis TaxID=480 RepID=A0A7Z1A3J3_MORCA|nr:hypothetical protein [Moraxella catarrhalis]OAV00242.1 Phage replication initiation protein [Moraxella catarrhalis]STY82510.1 Uncharacterised protein [Moraxella catarrhalis]
MSTLLINEPPLQVLPSLAVAIGLNEAMVLQQLHYLLAFSTTTAGGRKWVYNSYEYWQKQHFPFWSIDTVKRAFASLKNQGLVQFEQLQKKLRNKTNFYTINYQKLGELSTEIEKTKLQNEQVDQENYPDPSGQNALIHQCKMPRCHQGKMHSSISAKCTDPSVQNAPMSSVQNAPMSSVQNAPQQENTNRIPREYIQQIVSDAEIQNQAAQISQKPKTQKTHKSKTTYEPPQGFKATADQVERCRQMGLDPNDELVKFLDWHISRGNGFVNWERAFSSWIRNAKKYQNQPQTQINKGFRYDNQQPHQPNFDTRTTAGYAAKLARDMASQGLISEPKRGTNGGDW